MFDVHFSQTIFTIVHDWCGLLVSDITYGPPIVTTSVQSPSCSIQLIYAGSFILFVQVSPLYFVNFRRAFQF